MPLPDLNIINIVAAASPLIVVLYLMIFRNWGGSKAGPVGWLTSVIVSLAFFGANFELLLVAFGRSLLLALFVLYIIWMALLLYHVVNDAGAIQVIGRDLPSLANDKPAQALLLGWTFGSFLQGASGFGIPAAIVAPLLVGLGFAANTAVVVALLGHAWAVTFGSLGSSFFSLIAATGQPGVVLAGPSAALLAICALACGLGVLWATNRWQALKRRWVQLIVVGVIMALVQYVLALAGLYSLAAFGAGLAGLIVIVLDLQFSITDRLTGHRRTSLSEQKDQSEVMPGYTSPTFMSAMMPYLILTIIVILGQLVFREQLSLVTLNPIFPEVSTSFGWITPAGPGRSISLLGHAGALLMYTSILSFLWFRWRGSLSNQDNYSGRAIVTKTIRGSVKTTIGIITLVAMAVTMQHVAMTQLLAEGLSAGTGPLYPFLSPFIGALGAFMTGSNTNSNVVFGRLQFETATVLGLSVSLILAAQTAGGAIGSLFAPAKVIVGSSTVEDASEGRIFRSVLVYGLTITALIGLVVWLLTFVF
jgi:lactate permease